MQYLAISGEDFSTYLHVLVCDKSGHVEVSLKWAFEPRVTLGGTLNEQNLE